MTKKKTKEVNANIFFHSFRNLKMHVIKIMIQSKPSKARYAKSHQLFSQTYTTKKFLIVVDIDINLRVIAF